MSADEPKSKVSASYLSGTISAINPWGARSSTPKPDATGKDKNEKDAASTADGPPGQRGGDHSVSHGHRLRIKQYSPDCPPLNVQWFHAVDSAVRKPHYGAATPKDPKPPTPPKKWMAFSANDSRSIETAFNKLADEEDKVEEETSRKNEPRDMDPSAPNPPHHNERKGPHHKPRPSLAHLNDSEVPSPRVAVNEDYLFDVDIKARELGPAYWLGPVYAVRRGTWFYVEGTNLKPCDENLAFQLEEGYVKMRPWRNLNLQRSASQHSRTRSSAEALGQIENPNRQRSGSEASSSTAAVDGAKDVSPPNSTFLTHRLFGTHMNSVVTYEDNTVAWLLSDDFLSRMSSTVYERFAGGAHRSGTKLMRGFQDLTKKKPAKSDKRTESPAPRKDRSDSPMPTTQSVQAKKQSQVVSTSAEEKSAAPDDKDVKAEPDEPEGHMGFLQRQMSNLVTASFQEDSKQQEEERQAREEKEIREDYKDTPGDAQDRDIEHLVLVTHGIGQRLGARFETFNFIHDVNELRKTLKSVYGNSEDLQALNGEVDRPTKNCRLQVLPICWRHKLDFPRQNLKHSRREYDLSDADAEEDQSYPSLDDITIEGVPALRNIVADLALDVLLYQTPAYKQHISKIVAQECNHILTLFKQRNPTFRGKVSLIGHSLGSAVFFDLLSDQVKEPSGHQDQHHPAHHPKHKSRQQKTGTSATLDFDVESLVCVGSPIGLFQMLNGKSIGARTNPNEVTLDGLQEGIEDPFSETPYHPASAHQETSSSIDEAVSSPKCRQLYNVFHPSDPIAYRIEPLISPSMKALKPQALPYTKRSFLGAPSGHGITGIPALVGQSFSGFWSNLSSGIANNIINRSLGISAEDAAKLGSPASVPHNRLTASGEPLSVGAGTNITGGGVLSPDVLAAAAVVAANDDARKRKLVSEAAIDAEMHGRHPPTLIDNEIETLYSGYQKRRKSQPDGEQIAGDPLENPALRRLKREEAKVRALNSNGRVDYSIQEGAFDISFLSALSTHLSYWSDLDVAHFLLSQLLSKQRAYGKSK